MFEICTAMLSKQPHYEFGLRSIKSVIQLSVTMKATTMTTSQEEVKFPSNKYLYLFALFLCHSYFNVSFLQIDICFRSFSSMPSTG